MSLTKIFRLLKERRKLRHILYKRLYSSAETIKAIVDGFHKLYYDSKMFHGTWRDTKWLGVPIQKCPLDMWVYQEMLSELRPDLIIECGTASGGSAYCMATLCDLIGNGRIVTVDIDGKPERPKHDRITYLTGSSVADDVVAQVREHVREDEEVMVVLDSDHSMAHVLGELRIYGGFVRKGGYLIVEDSNVNGHPVRPDFGPGPMEAIEAFMKECSDFEIDKSREKFYLTFNPNGFLRKVR